MTRLFRSQSQSDSCTDSDTLSDDRLDSIEHASSSSEDDSLPENTAHFHHDDDNDDDEPLVPTFASLSASTRRTANDLAARLWSIDEDVSFVRAVKEANKQLPVVGQYQRRERSTLRPSVLVRGRHTTLITFPSSPPFLLTNVPMQMSIHSRRRPQPI